MHDSRLNSEICTDSNNIRLRSNEFNNYHQTNQTSLDTNQGNGFWEEELKHKNLKIKELNEEVLKLRIKTDDFQNSEATFRSYRQQIENLKKQKVILEEKLKIYDNETNNKSEYITEQLRGFSNAENYLKNQINNKDRHIIMLENNMKDKIEQLQRHSDMLRMKDRENQELRTNFHIAKEKLEMKEEEINKIREELENYDHGQKKMEDKMNQLIEIVKQQAKELTDYEHQTQIIDKDRKTLMQQDQHNLQEIDSWQKKYLEVKGYMNVSSDLQQKLNDKENVVKQLNDSLDSERMKNIKFTKINNDVNRELQDLILKHSGANSLELLNSEIFKLKEEKCLLKVSEENLIKANQFNKELELILKEIIKGVNNELVMIIQWISTYLGNYFEDENFQVPELSSTGNQIIRNKFKFGQLKEVLFNTRQTIFHEQKKSEEHQILTKRDINTLNGKLEKYLEFQSNQAYEVLAKKEEIYQLQVQLEIKDREITKLNDKILELKNDDKEEVQSFNQFYRKTNLSIISNLSSLRENHHLIKINEILKNNTYQGPDPRYDLEQNLDKIFQYLTTIVAEYQFIIIKPDDTLKLKTDNEKYKKELMDLRKNHKIEIDKIINERNDMIKNYETLKDDELYKIDLLNKQQLERLKQTLKLKEEGLSEISNENKLLKIQMEYLESSMRNYKMNKQETSYDLIEKIEYLDKSNKILERKYREVLREKELKEMEFKKNNRRNSETLDINLEDNEKRKDEIISSKDLELSSFRNYQKTN